MQRQKYRPSEHQRIQIQVSVNWKLNVMDTSNLDNNKGSAVYFWLITPHCLCQLCTWRWDKDNSRFSIQQTEDGVIFISLLFLLDNFVQFIQLKPLTHIQDLTENSFFFCEQWVMDQTQLCLSIRTITRMLLQSKLSVLSLPHSPPPITTTSWPFA